MFFYCYQNFFYIGSLFFIFIFFTINVGVSARLGAWARDGWSRHHAPRFLCCWTGGAITLHHIQMLPPSTLPSCQSVTSHGLDCSKAQQQHHQRPTVMTSYTQNSCSVPPLRIPYLSLLPPFSDLVLRRALRAHFVVLLAPPIEVQFRLQSVGLFML